MNKWGENQTTNSLNCSKHQSKIRLMISEKGKSDSHFSHFLSCLLSVNDKVFNLNKVIPSSWRRRKSRKRRKKKCENKWDQHYSSNVQSSVFSLQPSMYNLQCSMYNLQCSLFSLQSLMFSVQPSMFKLSHFCGANYKLIHVNLKAKFKWFSFKFEISNSILYKKSSRNSIIQLTEVFINLFNRKINDRTPLIFVSILTVHIECSYWMSILNVHTECPYWMFILNVHIKCSYWMFILNVHIECLCFCWLFNACFAHSFIMIIIPILVLAAFHLVLISLLFFFSLVKLHM